MKPKVTALLTACIAMAIYACETATTTEDKLEDIQTINAVDTGSLSEDTQVLQAGEELYNGFY